MKHCSLPSSSGISSLRVPTDRRKEKRLLPLGRLARSIKPRIGRLARTTKGSNDLGSGILGKRFGEGHGQTIPEKEMSAMQKTILDRCPQCRQSLRMSNTELLAAYNIALNTGDITEALRLANLVDFVAAAPAIAPRIIDTTAADNASKNFGFDFEGAILARGERLLHSI